MKDITDYVCDNDALETENAYLRSIIAGYKKEVEDLRKQVETLVVSVDWQKQLRLDAVHETIKLEDKYNAAMVDLAQTKDEFAMGNKGYTMMSDGYQKEIATLKERNDSLAKEIERLNRELNLKDGAIDRDIGILSHWNE